MANARKEPSDTWLVDLDLKTKEGIPLQIVYNADIEPENRGFVVDELQAFIGEQLVGYLKVENVPSENLAKFYPSGAANHAAQIGGRHLFGWPNDKTDWETCDVALLNNFIAYFDRHMPHGVPRHVENRQEFKRLFKTCISKLVIWKQIEKEFTKFKAHHVDNPFVAYSETRDPSKSFRSDISFAGRGIGKALYFAACVELDKRDLVLRQSLLLSDSARGIWTRFEELGLTIKGDRKLLTLNPQAVKDHLAELDFLPKRAQTPLFARGM